MATIQRIDTGYTAWTPSAAGLETEDEFYSGKHRKPENGKTFSLHRMLYRPKHRRP